MKIVLCFILLLFSINLMAQKDSLGYNGLKFSVLANPIEAKIQYSNLLKFKFESESGWKYFNIPFKQKTFLNMPVADKIIIYAIADEDVRLVISSKTLKYPEFIKITDSLALFYGINKANILVQDEGDYNEMSYQVGNVNVTIVTEYNHENNYMYIRYILTLTNK